MMSASGPGGGQTALAVPEAGELTWIAPARATARMTLTAIADRRARGVTAEPERSNPIPYVAVTISALSTRSPKRTHGGDDEPHPALEPDESRRRGVGTDGSALPRVRVIQATGDVDEEPTWLGLEQRRRDIPDRRMQDPFGDEIGRPGVRFLRPELVSADQLHVQPLRFEQPLERVWAPNPFALRSTEESDTTELDLPVAREVHELVTDRVDDRIRAGAHRAFDAHRADPILGGLRGGGHPARELS